MIPEAKFEMMSCKETPIAKIPEEMIVDKPLKLKPRTLRADTKITK